MVIKVLTRLTIKLRRLYFIGIAIKGFWFVVSGFWFVVSGFWFVVSGFWFVVSGF